MKVLASLSRRISEPRVGSRPFAHAAFVVALSALVAVSALLVSPRAEARKKRPPPILELAVYKDKVKLGVEVMRKISFEKIVNYSTTAKIKERGHRFKQRTHMKFDAQDHLQQYNRWIDVKGANTRNILFQFKKIWKIRSGDTTSGKFELTELSVKSPIVVLDARSPTLVSVAVDRAAGRSVGFVRVDNKTSGALTVRVQELIAPKSGQRFKRYTLTGKDLRATVLRDAQSKTVLVQGPGPYIGRAKGFKLPKGLQPAPTEVPEARSQPSPSPAPTK